MPYAKVFARMMDRLKKHGSAHPRKAAGNESFSEEIVQRVKNFFMETDRSHIREASNVLNLSVGTVWNVLRKKLIWKVYEPHKSQVISSANKLARKTAYEL